MNYSFWEKEYLLANIDYLIVGMGLVGLQVSIQLKEKKPKAKVVVIDRYPWGLGASTRNAGFGCFANVSEILDDLQIDTPQNVYETIRDRYHGLQKLRTNYGDKQIGYTEKGSCEIFTGKNKDELAAAIDSIRSINTILDAELGLDRVFTYRSNNPLPNVSGAIHNAYEGQLNTGMLYDTIRTCALRLGVQLFGGVDVKSWQNGAKIEVQTTDSLTIKTSHLILCTNAFTRQLIKEDIQPCRGQVIVSEQVASRDSLPCVGMYMYDKGYYYWRDIENRILLGGARNLDIDGERTDSIETTKPIVEELKRFMNEQIFGREVSIAYEWSGIMAMGSDNKKRPIVKEVEPNVYLAARLGGMGVALSANIAKETVKLVSDV